MVQWRNQYKRSLLAKTGLMDQSHQVCDFPIGTWFLIMISLSSDSIRSTLPSSPSSLLSEPCVTKSANRGLQRAFSIGSILGFIHLGLWWSYLVLSRSIPHFLCKGARWDPLFVHIYTRGCRIYSQSAISSKFSFCPEWWETYFLQHPLIRVYSQPIYFNLLKWNQCKWCSTLPHNVTLGDSSVVLM